MRPGPPRAGKRQPLAWLTRAAVDWMVFCYFGMIIVQAVTIAAFELGWLMKNLALVGAFGTSLIGPVMSFLVSLHVFRFPHRRKALDIFSVAITYVFTCTSFAVMYFIIADHEPHAFNLPQGSAGLGFTGALYFSVVTITTTGYGDVSPMSGLARLTACGEICTGLLYQVFVLSVISSFVAVQHRAPDAARHPD